MSCSYNRKRVPASPGKLVVNQLTVNNNTNLKGTLAVGGESTFHSRITVGERAEEALAIGSGSITNGDESGKITFASDGGVEVSGPLKAMGGVLSSQQSQTNIFTVVDRTTLQGTLDVTGESTFKDKVTVDDGARIKGGLEVRDGTLMYVSTDVPATASDNGIKGQIKWDENHIYICTSDNNWKRVAISGW